MLEPSNIVTGAACSVYTTRQRGSDHRGNLPRTTVEVLVRHGREIGNLRPHNGTYAGEQTVVRVTQTMLTMALSPDSSQS